MIRTSTSALGLGLILLSCKTTRPTIDVSQESVNPSEGSDSSRQAAVSPSNIGSNVQEDAIPKDMRRIEIFGLGLFEFVMSLNLSTKDELPLSKDEEGVFLYGCRPFISQEWVASGIEVLDGRIFGVQYTFGDEFCSGGVLLKSRDEKSLSFGMFREALRTRDVRLKKSERSWQFLLKSGEALTLTPYEHSVVSSTLAP